jgi:hypothetical protein
MNTATTAPKSPSPSTQAKPIRRFPGETDKDYEQRQKAEAKAHEKETGREARRTARREDSDDEHEDTPVVVDDVDQDDAAEQEAAARSEADYLRTERDREELRIRHGQVEVEIGKDYFADARALSTDLFNRYFDRGVDFYWVKTMLQTALRNLGHTWTDLRDAKAEKSKTKRSKILSDQDYSQVTSAYDPGLANPESAVTGDDCEAQHDETDRADSEDHGPSADKTGGAEAHPAPESTEPAKMRADHPEWNDPKKKSSALAGANMSSDVTPKEHKD